MKHSPQSKPKNETNNNKKESKNKRRSDIVGSNSEQEKVSKIKSEEKLKPISAMIKKSDVEEIPTIAISENQQQPSPPQTPSESELRAKTNIISPQNIPVHSEV